MRRLTLRKETLARLGDGTLRGVAGGTHLVCGVTDTCTHALACISVEFPCPTLDVACPSNPLTDCVPTDTCL